MAFAIKTADDRMSQTNFVKGLVLGPHGIGKTSLVKTLNPETTLFINMEAGDLAIKDYPCDMIDIRDFNELRELICIIGGPDPSKVNPLAPNVVIPYGPQHYSLCIQKHGERDVLFGKYDTIFMDSLTEMSRLGFQWAKTQEGALSEKTGKVDLRSVYGILGDNGIQMLKHLQHTPDKHIWMVAILDSRADELGQTTHKMQTDGSKISSELPGIMDEVIVLDHMQLPNGSVQRAFCTHKVNNWGYPSKDRSQQLDMIENPDLGALMRKIVTGERVNTMQTEIDNTVVEGNNAFGVNTGQYDQFAQNNQTDGGTE